ncbi:MAG: LytTR family DNA-binding domain-containing protein [Oscillospiraceae bacterium]
MKIAVCDDERVLCDALCKILEEYSISRGMDIVTYRYHSGQALLGAGVSFSAVFMDYCMDGLNGIDTLRRLRETDKDTAVIFLTSYPHIVFESFEVNTFRFLVKPVERNAVFAALDALLRQLGDGRFLEIPTADEVWRVAVGDIIYVEANRKRTVVRTAVQSFDCAKSLSALEKELPGDLFCRIHKSYIAGLHHIANHTQTTVLFDNGEQGLIGRSYRMEFKKMLSHYILKTNARE